MNILHKTNLKTKIFFELDQVELFSRYTDISTIEIDACLHNTNRKTHNRLRTDDHASVGFQWAPDKQTGRMKIRMFDFADPYWRGDIIDIAGKVLRLNANLPRDFVEICKHILLVGVAGSKASVHSIRVEKEKEVRTITPIGFTIRDYSKYDLQYWGKAGITKEDLIKARIFAVESAYNSKGELMYVHRAKDVCYVLLLDCIQNTNVIKLYFINRGRHGDKRARFITNNIYPLEAMHELTKADVLVITKSRSDTIVIRKLLAQISSTSFSFTGGLTILVTNFTAETHRLTEALGNYLASTYKYVFINTDFDRAGRACAIYHLRKFGFQPLFLTNGRFGTKDYGAKDVRDYVMKFGVLKGQTLMLNTIENIVNDLILIDNRKIS